MPQTIKKIFKNLKNIEPSTNLEKRILEAISMTSAKSVRRKLMIARAGLAVSLGALVYTLAVFGRAFLQSDFWNLVKLIFSDTGFIIQNLGNFSLSLLETLPIVEIFALLVPVFVLLMVASWYFKFENSNHYNHA